MVRQARCCCGAATISVEGEPELNGICHCDDCRRRTGSAFGWSAYFRDDRIVGRTGETSVYLPLGDPGQARRFCLRCGTTLSWKTPTLPDLTGIAGGCFVEAPLAEPVRSYRSHRKLRWIALPAHWQMY